jgi:hypothetical protein
MKKANARTPMVSFRTFDMVLLTPYLMVMSPIALTVTEVGSSCLTSPLRKSSVNPRNTGRRWTAERHE